MPSSRIRVVVADDHPVYLDGLVAAIRERPELVLVGVANDGFGALRLLRELQPDVAVLDLRLPGLEGTDVLRAAKETIPALKVLMLSAVTTSIVVYDAIHHGANGYAVKSAARATICDAIVIVARNGFYASPELSSAIAREIGLRSTDAPQNLSAREHEILTLLAEGLTVHDVAERIHVSPSTVKSLQGRMYAKLGVSGSTAAVAEAMRRGLLE
jgi:two-component system nitrate/nitrite response regulator NarL